MKQPVNLLVNGKNRLIEIESNQILLDVLRNELRLTGAKEGCREGECGACAVLIDGEIYNACVLLATQVAEKTITTIEGLADKDKLHTIQEAFVEYGAVQCGFCIPGLIIAAKALLDKNPNPTDDEINTAISGNLCRCTGYIKVVEAIKAAAKGQPTLAEKGLKPIGRNYARFDATDKVTGKAVFGADVILPGMLYGAILRAKYPHAKILKIDTSKAEQLPGVEGVVTGQEVPRGYYGVDLKDQLVFAREKVRYLGDAVAAVAATTQEIAEKAIELIEVEYEELPALFDPLESMKPDAVIVHEDIEKYDCTFDINRHGNMCTHTKVRVGDVEKGFEEADYVFEDTYETKSVHQASIETHCATASFDPSGKITVWTTTQKPLAILSM